MNYKWVHNVSHMFIICCIIGTGSIESVTIFSSLVRLCLRRESRLPTYQRIVGSIPNPSGQYVKMSMGEILNSELLLMTLILIRRCQFVTKPLQSRSLLYADYADAWAPHSHSGPQTASSASIALRRIKITFLWHQTVGSSIFSPTMTVSL